MLSLYQTRGKTEIKFFLIGKKIPTKIMKNNLTYYMFNGLIFSSSDQENNTLNSEIDSTG